MLLNRLYLLFQERKASRETDLANVNQAKISDIIFIDQKGQKEELASPQKYSAAP